MKKTLQLLSMLLLGFSALYAQVPQYYDANTGGGTQWPLSSSTNKVQWIYEPGLFNSNGSTGTPATAGLITTVYLRITTTSSVSFSDFTISLGQTLGTDATFSNTTFLTNLTPGFTQNGYVFTGAVTNSWYAIPLQTPFLYDPSLSLVVEVKTSSSFGIGVGVALGAANVTGNRRNAGGFAATTGSLSNIGIANFGFDMGTPTPITSLTVATQGSVPATINTNAGTLQMTATVLPSGAPQGVTWSIVPGTGAATISATGLVTASANGTVWAKAVSLADATKKDSLQITISNQVVPVTSVTVATQGSVPATISTNAGTLQMTATVLPAAANQNIIWSIVQATGTATISSTGLVTAQSNGTVWAKAVSVADATKMDSMQITISNQNIPVTSVIVTTQNGIPATVTTNGGTLQMAATVLPAAANQNVVWSIVPGTSTAGISATGLVTAQTNGTVWAKAVSVADATKMDSLQITISGQSVGINDLAITAEDLKLYPNPANGQLRIENNSNYRISRIALINILGQEVYSNSTGSNRQAINVNHLTPGIYNVKIVFKEGEVNRKLDIIR